LFYSVENQKAMVVLLCWKPESNGCSIVLKARKQWLFYSVESQKAMVVLLCWKAESNGCSIVLKTRKQWLFYCVENQKAMVVLLCWKPESNGCSIVLKARKQWLFYCVESKLFLISKYNKTIDKVFRGKKILIIISNCPIYICTDFLTALSLNAFFQSKWWKLSLISENLVDMMFVFKNN
jgi:hypothetical protein